MTKRQEAKLRALLEKALAKAEQAKCAIDDTSISDEQRIFSSGQIHEARGRMAGKETALYAVLAALNGCDGYLETLAGVDE